jgi:hypothetical protein
MYLNMNRNLVRSTAIGIFMGLSIALINMQNLEYGILIAILICLVSGVLSAQVEEYARLYALFSSLVSFPFFVFANGFNDGFTYFIGALFVYGTLSFSITYGLQNAFYNGKAIFRYFFKK